MKKILILLIIAITCIPNAQSQSPKNQEYIEQYKDIAINEMLRSGIPAAITLAQGILESGAGQSNLVKESNNHFGIKCKTDWTGEKVYHNDDATGECFRSYNNAEDSYKDHSDFLRTRAHYAFLFKLDPTDYEGWAKGLRKAGYATNPAYPQLLIKTIVDNNLQQYTLYALNLQQNKDVFASNTKEENIKTKATPDPEVITIEEDSLPNLANKATEKTVTSIDTNSSYPSEVFDINQLKVIFVSSGTSLLALANLHNISYQKLLEFNELEKEQDILERNQLIFLEKKSKKGSKDIHIVDNNETLYDIAQKEGIRLEALLIFNRIPKGREVISGEKIYLRFNSPTTPKLHPDNNVVSEVK